MKIGRTAYEGKAVYLVVEILLVPNVIPERECIYAAPKKLQGNLACYACASSSIFAIGNDQVETILLSITRKPFLQETASGSTDDIAKKENFSGPGAHS